MAAEVRVLGPVAVVGNDGAVALPAKHARLLAALAIADGRALGVDELVEAVWDGTAPASARKLVQVYVSQLRKTLPEGCSITTRGSAYAIELAPDVLDAKRFEHLVDDAREAERAGNAARALSRADRALALWRGRAYGELAYEEFARGESERLEEVRLVALEERLSALLALGRHDDALGEALTLANEQPFRERLHELAMLALYRAGRQADALEHYADVRARFDRELGLEPGSTLRELQRRILQQDVELEAGATLEPAGALPVPPNVLVGRARELAELRSLLERRESRLIVLTGAGGSGKTRLALEAARESAGTFANGAAFVELAPLRDPGLVAQTIARALDISVDSTGEPLSALAEGLATQELLLVVDNAEHVRAAAPAFAELVARVPSLTLLVTSRAVLHVSGERVFPVSPLAVDDAVELFVQRAQLLDPAFERTSENDAETREICARVDCLPLAIELAAARIRTLTPRALRQRLAARLSVLTGGPRDLPARQQTLRETIAWSVGLLDERPNDVLARLAVFPAGATLDAAERVCGADLDTLAALVDDHLIRRDDLGGEPRFGMLETVREYALELLGEKRQSAALAMASFLAGVVDEVDVAARTDLPALARLDPELDNIRAGLAACSEAGDTELEVRLAGGMWRYCWVRGLGREGLKWIEGALDRAEGAPTAARARALHGAGGLAWSTGDSEHAIQLARTAIPIAVESGSTWDEIAAHTVLGVATNTLGDREGALAYHRRGLELAEQVGIEPVVQKLNIATIALDLEENEEAREMLTDVLAIHRRNENSAGIGFALLNRGVANHELGDYEASLRDFEEARDRFEEVGFRAQVAFALQGLAAVEASEGRHEQAARLLGHARRELDEIGSPEGAFGVEMVPRTDQRARAALGDEAFEAAYAAGRESGS